MATTSRRIPKSLDVDKHELFREVAKRIPDMNSEELAELLTDLNPLRAEDTTEAEHNAEKQQAAVRIPIPTNDDELWNLIKSETGYEIPRVAVCEDHCAPFQPIADAYFGRESAILIMASREGGKTIGVAVLHFINAETKPGIEGISFGAIKRQAEQSHKYVKSFVYARDDDGNRVPKPQILGDPTREKTEWKSGSLIQIIVGTKSGVNSPHPQVVHADEVDLMEEEIFAESRNMSSSKQLPNGVRYGAVDIVTSTRKSTRGPMQRMLDEVEKAEKEGHIPPWKVYAFCFKEAAAEVPNCRCVDPIVRVKRMLALGLDPKSICQCDKIVKGEWDEGNPRTLESVCRGDLFKSRGWMHFDDISRKFTQNGQAVWEAQMECRRPMADGLYLPSFSRARHTVRGWVPRPQYGRVTMGVDWGGGDSSFSVVLWVQGPLHQPVEIMGFGMKPVVVPQNAYVIFDGEYFGRIGASKMADFVVAKEINYKNKYPGWRCVNRFVDIAGAQARNDWHEHNPPLRTHWELQNRDFDPTIETVQQMMLDNRIYVDLTSMSELVDDFEGWRQKNGKEVHDDSSHGPAALRYNLTNNRVLERRREKNMGKAEAVPAVRERSLDSIDQGGMVGVGSTSTQQVNTEAWRQSMGIMTRNSGSDGWKL